MGKNTNMKIIICGCNGKMGKAVVESVEKFENSVVVAGVDINHSESNEFPVFESIEKVNLSADVIIDFSHPSALSSILEYSEKNKIPAVICTTGLSGDQIEDIKKVAHEVPIFYSRNMSLGINLLLELAKTATKVLGENFDIEIIEKHHNQKIDAPSGTAMMIAEEISETLNNNTRYVFDRTQRRSPRSKNEIGIHSVRGGSIPGEHEIIFAGKDEIITLSHHAGSRNIFALGALHAAKFIYTQSPGLYSMKDMIKNS